MEHLTPRLPHLAQLDALRAFAVTAVLIHHYTADGWGYGATSGVRLFFTLSGFLITGILLRARDDAEARNLTRIGALGRFYARRVLRIFPLYYFVVGMTYAIGLEPVRPLIWWLLTYTLNIHFAHQGWFDENVAHFWSLSVEEQFYVGWPWLILFLPRKWLMPVALMTICVGPLYRLSYILSGYSNVTELATYVSTPACLDNLGLGALLAMWVQRYPVGAAVGQLPTRVVLPVSILLLVILEVLGDWHWSLVLHAPIQAVAFCCVIYGAAKGYEGMTGRVLEYKPILYLGKISYGVYVYHPLTPLLVVFTWLKFTGTLLDVNSGLVSGLATVTTLAAASLSWHAMERPLNDLKRYF